MLYGEIMSLFWNFGTHKYTVWIQCRILRLDSIMYNNCDLEDYSIDPHRIMMFLDNLYRCDSGFSIHGTTNVRDLRATFVHNIETPDKH